MHARRMHGAGALLSAALLMTGGSALAAGGDEPQQSEPRRTMDRESERSVDRVKTTEKGTSSDRTNQAETSAARSAGKTGTTKSEGMEADVLNSLHKINQEEIAMGKVAQDRAQSDAAKSYAKQLVDDHQDADSKVTDLAKKHNIELASVEPDRSHMEKLQGLQGPAFDKTFAQMMVKGHAQAIKLVKRARAQASDKDFTDLLDGLLPKLEEHERMAKDLLKGGAERAMGRRPPRTR